MSIANGVVEAQINAGGDIDGGDNVLMAGSGRDIVLGAVSGGGSRPLHKYEP